MNRFTDYLKSLLFMLLAYTMTALICDYVFQMNDEAIAPIAKSTGLAVLASCILYYMVIKKKLL